ncbi:MAG: DUF3592 domain-containing protein [Oscillospiraceae bacterium]|nr:DUF3592 domain-containing protein [Oscillospiraceae bacterium]
MEQKSNVKSKQQLVIFSILLVVGLASLIFSAVSYFQFRSETANYATVEGRVVSHQQKTGQKSDGSQITRFVEVVEYQVNGTIYQVVSSVEKTSPAAIGTAMSVKYDPSNPDRAVIAVAASQTTLISGGFGIFMIVVSFLVVFQKSKSKNTSNLR